LICAAIACLFPSTTTYTDPTGRFTWISLHPIAAVTYEGLAAVLALSRVLSGDEGRGRFGMTCWLVPLLAVLLLSNSRGPLLAFVGSAAAVLLKRTPSAAVRALLLVLLVVALSAAAATFTEPRCWRFCDGIGLKRATRRAPKRWSD
jgi:hypothetical protein